MAKKALLIIASKNFRDEELFHTMEELEKVGVGVTIASTTTSPARGMLGGTATPNVVLNEARSGDYDAVLFIGGSGASVYFNDSAAHGIANNAYKKGKIVGAICIAPSTLANAGLLKGKKATSYPSERGNLESKGAKFTGAGVEVDGKIITADGPASAREFGRTIASALA